MAIKALRDVYRFADNGIEARVAFITHSAALAHDVLPGMLYALDPNQRWAELKQAKLWLGSIYELAQELLQYERKDLRPLSTDGREGRELQAMMIDDAIQACLNNTRFAARDLARCSPEFAPRLTDRERRTALVADLMNEFACILDAEGTRKGTLGAAQYVEEKRENWQMNLPSENDRAAVLDIHERYCIGYP